VTLGLYARFIEPSLLLTNRHEVTLCGKGLPGTLTAAVLSDTHHGIFGNAVPMDRLVRRLRALSPDLVLMPGDFTYYPNPDDLPGIVAPLAGVGAPVYAVMGNHDVGLPGPDYTEPLTAALEAAGVTVLNPGTAVFSKNGKYVRIAGLRDLYQVEETGLPLGVPEPSALPTIYLQHNPDLIVEWPEVAEGLGRFDLMVAGHTHGGQVYLPGITCWLTFACDTLRYGYADNPAGKLFVTSGTGMVALPIRFGAPPVIDLLDIRIDRCGEIEPKRGFDLDAVG
jgi:predicted MPP superfamily phosphohydrolase